MIQPLAPLWTEQVYQQCLGRSHIYLDSWTQNKNRALQCSDMEVLLLLRDKIKERVSSLE